jgi:hypothetical protein
MGQDRELIEDAISKIGRVALKGVHQNSGFVFHVADVRKILKKLLEDAAVAQMEERLTCNQGVEGSNPSGGSSFPLCHLPEGSH